MIFKDSYITEAGLNLFLRAMSEEGRINWTMAAISDRNCEGLTVSEMNALAWDDFGKFIATGDVSSVVAGDGQKSVTLQCELNNSHPDGGDAWTFGIGASIEGDLSDDLVIVARCGQGVTPVKVNPPAVGKVKLFVDLALDIDSQAVQVQLVESCYASVAALQAEVAEREALAGRVVTMHHAIDPTIGEAQTVRGRKTFKHALSVEYDDFMTNEVKQRYTCDGGSMKMENIASDVEHKISYDHIITGEEKNDYIELSSVSEGRYQSDFEMKRVDGGQTPYNRVSLRAHPVSAYPTSQKGARLEVENKRTQNTDIGKINLVADTIDIDGKLTLPNKTNLGSVLQNSKLSLVAIAFSDAISGNVQPGSIINGNLLHPCNFIKKNGVLETYIGSAFASGTMWRILSGFPLELAEGGETHVFYLAIMESDV